MTENYKTGKAKLSGAFQCMLPVRMTGILPKHFSRGLHNNETRAFTTPNGTVAKPMYFMPMEHAMYD